MKPNKYKLLIDAWWTVCVACVSFRIGREHGSWLWFTSIIWLPFIGVGLFYLVSQYNTHRRLKERYNQL